MKNLNLATFLLVITLVFTSCTQEDNVLLRESTAEHLLKSFNLSKNAKGDFSLHHELGTGFADNIYLHSSEERNLRTKDGELKVTFSNNDRRIKSITILDDDPIETKSVKENELLVSYGIAGNGDDTYDLDFVVEDEVSVNFVFDGDRNVYEIHLTKDVRASRADFTQTFTKEEGVALNIEFVNSLDISLSKSVAMASPNRPVIIIEFD